MPGLQIGYEHTFVHQVADFLEDLANGKPTAPTFRDALATQAVCDAVLESGEDGQVGGGGEAGGYLFGGSKPGPISTSGVQIWSGAMIASFGK